MTNQLDEAFWVTTFILRNIGGMSLRSVSALWTALGFEISHESVNKICKSIDALDAILLYTSAIGDSVPHALIRYQESRKPKRDRRHSLKSLDECPTDFLLEMLPWLRPNDLENLQRILIQKRNNAACHKLTFEMTILDFVTACVAYRRFNSDESDIWKNQRTLDVCRYRDEGIYSLKNAVLRPHAENCRYARAREHTNGENKHHRFIEETDRLVRDQIKVQLGYQKRWLNLSQAKKSGRSSRKHRSWAYEHIVADPSFSVIDVTDIDILIGENDDEEAPSPLKNPRYLMARLHETFGLDNRKVYFRNRNGGFLELLQQGKQYVRIDSVGKTMKQFLESRFEHAIQQRY